MLITKIKISNILGVDAIEIEPGQITEISGKNGLGKTSIIEAIKTAIGGGRIGKIVSNGSDKGEIVLLLDDGTEIRKTITGDKAKLNVMRDGVPQSSAQKYVSGLYDALGINPVEVITADPKRRGQLVLEAMPMAVDLATLQEAVGDIYTVRAGTESGHALDAIQEVYDTLYMSRRDINREEKEKRATIEQLSRSLPDGEENADDISAELESRISEMVGYENEIEELKTKISSLAAENAAMRVRRDAIQRDENTRATLGDMTKNADKLEAKSKAITEAMARTEAIKKTFLDNLPLPVTIEDDGEVYADGIPFATLNSARKTTLALELAALRAGELPLICVDGLEMLDDESYEAFRTWASSRPDLQFIVTRVSNDPLAITTA